MLHTVHQHKNGHDHADSLARWILVILVLFIALREYGLAQGIKNVTAAAASGSVPSGMILFVDTGTCPTGYAEQAALAGLNILATTVAAGDAGTTGGSNSFTPTVASTNLSAAAQTFTGDVTTVPAETVNSLTAAAQTVSSLTAAAQTISYPADVPAFTGSAGTVPAQTFTGSSVTSGATSGGTPAGTNGASATSGNCAATNIAAGTGSTTACKATAPALVVTAQVFTGSALATHTHSVTAAGTNGTAAFTPAGTVAWPVNPPSNGTSAVTGTMNSSAVSGTLNSTSLTPLGHTASSSVTGTITLNTGSITPPYIKLIPCKKT